MPALYWENGLIKMPLNVWRSPTKRRLPHLLIENRAREVVMQLTLNLDEQRFIFKETNTPVTKLTDSEFKYELKEYSQRYLFPNLVGQWDLLDYLRYFPIYIFATDNKFYFTCDELGGPPKDLPSDWYINSFSKR